MNKYEYRVSIGLKIRKELIKLIFLTVDHISGHFVLGNDNICRWRSVFFILVGHFGFHVLSIDSQCVAGNIVTQEEVTFLKKKLTLRKKGNLINHEWIKFQLDRIKLLMNFNISYILKLSSFL